MGHRVEGPAADESAEIQCLCVHVSVVRGAGNRPDVSSPPMPRKSRADRTLHDSAFRRRLLGWFRRHGRDLPWRRTRDPYRIVVSEFMLQQTQVSRVEGYYHRFLEQLSRPSRRWPRRPPPTVRESWEGLGYYRRAANLHRLAQAVVAEHGGVVPADPAVLLRRSPAWAATPRGRWRASPTSGRRRRWTPTSPGCIRRAFHPRARRPARATQDLGDGRADRAPARGSAPGPSIRRSWSWERWCVRRGWRGVGSAR